MSAKSIRLSLDVSPEMYDMLEEMSNKAHSTKSDLMRKSLFLMMIAIREKEQGHYLGIIGKDKKLINEIVGV